MTYTGERHDYQSILWIFLFLLAICFLRNIIMLFQRAHRFRKSREVPGGLSGGSSLRRIYVSSILKLMRKSTCLHPIFSQLDRWKLRRCISCVCALLQPWRGDILSKLHLRSSIMSGSMMCASDNNNGVSSKLEHWCNTTKRTSGVQMRRAWGMWGDGRERPRCGKFCPSSLDVVSFVPPLSPGWNFCNFSGYWRCKWKRMCESLREHRPMHCLYIHGWT